MGLWNTIVAGLTDLVVQLPLTLLLLFMAKVVMDLRLKWFHGVNAEKQISDYNNQAMAIMYLGYYIGVFIGFSGAIHAEGMESSIGWLCILGLASLALVHLGLFFCDVTILFGINDVKEMAVPEPADAVAGERTDKKAPAAAGAKLGNQAVACVWAGSAVASGLVINGALNDLDSGWLVTLIWYLIGQVGFILVAWAYKKLTPYDDDAELAQNNRAVGWDMAGVLLAFGILFRKAISGDFTSWTHDLLSLAVYLPIAVVILLLLRWVIGLIFIRGSLTTLIVRDKNAGVGMISGSLMALSALALTYFM
ncbi:MAG: DUF350 domain-containing protein [Deltaproteobacteria bacterium]|nr:DUF350 domain-containing protein [Deltaproteobacteria bacterium]